MMLLHRLYLYSMPRLRFTRPRLIACTDEREK